jgi:membrane protein DedA with SNARE-associated domain
VNNKVFIILSFLGSFLIIGLALYIFIMLMEREMPESNRELLIAFVSVLFGAMAASMKTITGGRQDN